MSEGKGQWVRVHSHWVEFSTQDKGEYPTIYCEDIPESQMDNLAAWLNHIAPDGILPPAPETTGRDSADVA